MSSHPGGANLILVMRYRDLAGAIDWLCGAFGFAKHHVGNADKDGPTYAQLTFSGTMISLGRVGDAAFDTLMKQPDEIGGAETQASYFIVEDADAHYGRARAPAL